MPAVQADLPHLLAAFMEAQPEARPILRKFFFMHATHEWVADAPQAALEAAAPAMSAMHRAMECRDYAEAPAHPKVWAQLPGVTEGDAAAG